MILSRVRVPSARAADLVATRACASRVPVSQSGHARRALATIAACLALAASFGAHARSQAQAEQAQAASASPAELILPPSTAASAWERARARLADPTSSASTQPAATWPATPAGGWSSAPAYERWAELLELEAAASAPSAARRAELALCAAAQGRSEAAWSHFAAAASDARLAERLLPVLFPGVPAEHAPGALGLPSALPEGVLLRPMLPPGALARRGHLVRSEVTVSGIRIGAAQLRLALRVDLDGAQLDFVHEGGGPCRLRVALTSPLELAIDAHFFDWQQRETDAQGAIELAIEPGSERVALWARFAARPATWSGRAPPALPAEASQAGYALWIPEADPERAALAGLARALTRVCGTRFDLVERPASAFAGAHEASAVQAEHAPASAPAGTSATLGPRPIRLAPGAERRAQLALLCQAAEDFAGLPASR